jgi:hypothetical protein
MTMTDVSEIRIKTLLAASHVIRAKVEDEMASEEHVSRDVLDNYASIRTVEALLGYFAGSYTPHDKTLLGEILAAEIIEPEPSEFEKRRRKEQEHFDAALQAIRDALPAAKTVELETSDQDYYGFFLREVQDGSGDVIEVPGTLEDTVAQHIQDLDWNGVVREDKHGNVTIDLYPVAEHDIVPDDDPEPGNRCKTCGKDITWIGPSTVYDWEHSD